MTIYMKLPINLWHCMVLFFKFWQEYCDKEESLRQELESSQGEVSKLKQVNFRKSSCEIYNYACLWRRRLKGLKNASMHNQHSRVSDIKIYFLFTSREKYFSRKKSSVIMSNSKKPPQYLFIWSLYAWCMNSLVNYNYVVDQVSHFETLDMNDNVKSIRISAFYIRKVILH